MKDGNRKIRMLSVIPKQESSPTTDTSKDKSSFQKWPSLLAKPVQPHEDWIASQVQSILGLSDRPTREQIDEVLEKYDNLPLRRLRQPPPAAEKPWRSFWYRVFNGDKK